MLSSVRSKVVAGVVALAVVGGVGFALFERHERGAFAAAAEKPCPAAAPAGVAMPLDVPLHEGATVRRVTEQGAATVAFADVPGGRDDIVTVRDAVLADLKAAGYDVVGTDQEPGFEAEAEVAGPHEGTLRVVPLCEGTLEVRYALS